MMEYDIYNPTTRKYDTIWGYDWFDAFRRFKLNPDEWDVIREVFID